MISTRQDMEIQTVGLPEEDTTKGSEGAEEVGLPRNRRLSHVDIGGGMDGPLAGRVLDLLVGCVHDGGSRGCALDVRVMRAL